MTNTILILIPSVVKQVCVRERWGWGLGAGVRGEENYPEPMPAAPSTLQKVNAPWFVNIYQTPTGGGGEYPAASEGFLGAKNNTRLPNLESELRAAWSALAKPSLAPFSSSSFHSGSAPLPLLHPPSFFPLSNALLSPQFSSLYFFSLSPLFPASLSNGQ